MLQSTGVSEYLKPRAIVFVRVTPCTWTQKDTPGAEREREGERGRERERKGGYWVGGRRQIYPLSKGPFMGILTWEAPAFFCYLEQACSSSGCRGVQPGRPLPQDHSSLLGAASAAPRCPDLLAWPLTCPIGRSVSQARLCAGSLRVHGQVFVRTWPLFIAWFSCYLH